MRWLSPARCVVVALNLSFLVPLFAQEPVVVKPSVVAEDSIEKSSYMIGFSIGNNLADNGFIDKDFESATFIKGLMDALAKKESALDANEQRAVSAAIDARLQARAAQAATQNLAQSKEFLAANQKKDGIQTLKSGLQYQEIKKGQGKSPALTSVVRVHYEGKLINGQIFDSSIKRGEPAEFPVDRVIKGWTEALQRMVVGDKWRLFIPPELAYGEQGAPGGTIGPNEALIFEVELLDIVR